MRPRDNTSRQNQEFEEKVIQVKRVSKKNRGGNKIGFTALVVVGDKKGRVGMGYGKASDVASAISKGLQSARKSVITIKMKDNTIAHEVMAKYGSAKVYLTPAPKGTGIIAGGAVRPVINLAGIKDISAKMIGANNKMCNIKGTLAALQKLKG
jgi:small subunit ribosomal protein S5